MSTLRISDAPLLPDVDGTEKIPTGGRGDYAISVDQIKDHIFQDVGKELVGLGNVDNTSDLDKPVSTAQQAALNLKADKTYVDSNLDLKADKTNVYTRSETSLALSKKADLVNGVIPENQIPSSFNDVLEFTTSTLPIVGESGKIYVTTDTNRTWRWSGNQYVEVSNGGISDSTLKLQTPRKISNVDFDGTQNIDIPHNNLINRDIVGAHLAVAIQDESGYSQQEINNSAVQLIQNIESLRNYKGNKNKQQVGTLEYHTDSGYGGALYQWDSSSNADDDGFSVIAVTGVSTGRWKLQLRDKTLHATQAGLKANLLQTDLVNQSAILQKCIDYMALIGGGIVKLPKGHIYAQVLAKSNVHIQGTFESFVTTKTYAEIAANPTGVVQEVRYEHGTLWHSTGSTDLFYMPENVSNCEISNLKMLGLRLDQSTSACGFGMRIIGDSFTARYVDTSGFRFEGLYIRGVVGADCGNHYFENCNFDDARRNTAALVFCHDVHFKNCKFRQLKPELSWVYLFDIEPNPSTADTVYNVTMENCEFNAVSSSGAEPTVLVKEQNTPTGSPNVKFLNCRFKGVATIRNNCANGWKDCIVDNCEFDTWAFSTTLGYTIISGRFTNNRLYGIGSKGFSFNTPATGDFIIEGNIFNDTVFNGNIITNQASFGLNTFTGTAHVVAPVDRRSITAQYRTITAAEVVSPTSAPLPAISYIAVRQVNLTTTLADVLTVRLRSGVKITITGCDANDGTGSKAFVDLFINSDNTTSVTAANEIINPATYGITFAWNGRTLQLASKSAAANQFIVKVEVLSALSQYKDVAWLI